jgi:hypothetical protein
MPLSPGSDPRITLPSGRRGVGPGGGGAGFVVAGGGMAKGWVGALGASCANDGTAHINTIAVTTVFTPTSTVRLKPDTTTSTLLP